MGYSAAVVAYKEIWRTNCEACMSLYVKTLYMKNHINRYIFIQCSDFCFNNIQYTYILYMEWGFIGFHLLSDINDFSKLTSKYV